MSSPRKSTSHLPNYKLLVTSGSGQWWHAGFNEIGLVGVKTEAEAKLVSGAGLASAVRALEKRGMTVEKVPA